MRVIFTIFLWCHLGMAGAQNTLQSQQSSYLLLSQIGKLLYQYEVAVNYKTPEQFSWHFILAEEDLRSAVTKEIAKELTSFSFRFDRKTKKYKAIIDRTKPRIQKVQVLAMVYQSLKRNVNQYGRHLDYIKLDDQYHYILYFPYGKTSTSRN